VERTSQGYVAPVCSLRHRSVPRFLLRLADEQHAFLAVELLALRGGYVIFTLARFKRNDGQFLFVGQTSPSAR
jgi:hypothetical protein